MHLKKVIQGVSYNVSKIVFITYQLINHGMIIFETVEYRLLNKIHDIVKCIYSEKCLSWREKATQFRQKSLLQSKQFS